MIDTVVLPDWQDTGEWKRPDKNVRFYEIPLETEDESGAYEVSDQIQVIIGIFENLSGDIWKIKQHAVDVRLHPFGKNMSMEV